jgi:hypothetical protein
MERVVLGVYMRKWREPNSFIIKMNEITLEDGIIRPNCATEAGNDGGRGRGKVFAS